MPEATTRRSPHPRRWSRARGSQPQQRFLLHCSIAAVLALVLAFSDAESMRAHHHDAGQGYARPSKRRDTSAGRDKFGVAAAAAAAASSWTCDDSRRSRRVEGGTLSSSGGGGDGGGIYPFTRTSNGGAPGRGAAARLATTAFVASSGWAAGAICSAREDAAGASMSMTRRRRRHAHPTQEQQPSSQGRFAGAAGPQRSRGGSRGGGSSLRGDFQDATAFPASHAGQGRHMPCSFYGPAPWNVASASASASNNVVPCMRAGGGGADGGGGGGGGLTRPPLLITIGPQCAGKTSLLQRLAGKSKAARQREGSGSGSSSSSSSSKSGVPSVTDVTIDDHPSVYHKIPTGVLLDGCDRGSREDTLVGRRALSDRLCDPGCVETRLVALRLVGGISAEEFADRLKGYGGQASPAALATLCSAVETAVSEKAGVSTPTVDVFVRENLFPDAISSSQERLALAARAEDGLVAWGNTNTQARDFRGALEQAELTDRPVRFLRWGHELPVLSLEELTRRNVRRFASTGRYVEVAAVESALSRVDKLYSSTFGGDPASLALAAATAARPGLAQEWAPRGGSGSARAPTGEGSSRRWDHYSSAGAMTGPASVPPTVMFGNEWGRMREWRRTGYTDDDIDPTLSSCFFRKPANSTGELRRSDLGEGSGPDLEEMELVRRIRSFRERR